jgi:two-component sensor histidine kinase
MQLMLSSGNKDGIIKIRINLEDTKLVLLFSDNGHGIPQESIKDKIFHSSLSRPKDPDKELV